jgi:hypothetical protein
MKSRRLYAVMLLFLAFVCPPTHADAAGATPTPDQQRIRVLAELLASKNAVCGTQCDRFPKGYDRHAQVVVYLAIQQLLAEGPAGFDTLIEHFKDGRYCYTYAAPDDNYNATVGGTCALIMTLCIRCYANEIHVITDEQFTLPPDFGKEGLAAR